MFLSWRRQPTPVPLTSIRIWSKWFYHRNIHIFVYALIITISPLDQIRNNKFFHLVLSTFWPWRKCPRYRRSYFCVRVEPMIKTHSQLPYTTQRNFLLGIGKFVHLSIRRVSRSPEVVWGGLRKQQHYQLKPSMKKKRAKKSVVEEKFAHIIFANPWRGSCASFRRGGRRKV